jgi:CRP-like cAMP-binding protein
METLASTLRKSNLFKNKSVDEIDALLAKLHYKVQLFAENEIVFSADQLANTLGIILSGMVEVQKIFPSGRIVTVTSRGSFDLLADAAMFAETHYYPATISACKSSKIFLLPKTELLKLFSLDQAVMLNFLCSVSNRIFVLNRKIELLSLNSIQTKIAHFLISESEIHSSNIIQLPFSKKSWAEHINVSRTSLSRELRQLEKEGLITFNKRSIKIQDIEKLKRILL